MPLELNGTTGVQGNSGALVSGTAVASTSGTSIDFTGIPSWVKRITVMFNGVSGNGSSNPLIQLGTSGGIVSTGYSSTGTNLQPGGSVVVFSTSTGMVIGNNSAATSLYGSITITNVSGNIWVASGNFSTIVGLTVNYSTSGGVTLSGTLDRVRITMTNGTDTFDAGSINILYE